MWGRLIETDASEPEPLVETWGRAVGAYESHDVPPVHRIAAEPAAVGEQELWKSYLELDNSDTKYWAEEHCCRNRRKSGWDDSMPVLSWKVRGKMGIKV